MKKFKKLIAVALAVILSLSVMSVAAFASTTDSLKRTADGTWLYMENGEHNAYYTGLVKYYALGIMLKTAFLIGTIQALPSITAQHIMS